MKPIFANKHGWLISICLYVKKNGQEGHLLILMMRDDIWMVHFDKCTQYPLQ